MTDIREPNPESAAVVFGAVIAIVLLILCAALRDYLFPSTTEAAATEPLPGQAAASGGPFPEAR